MKRIRLEVPDDWPGQFKLYNQAHELLRKRVKLTGAVEPRDVADTFKLLASLKGSIWAQPSFRAWAAVRCWTSTTEIVLDLLAFDREVEELNRLSAEKAALEETPL